MAQREFKVTSTINIEGAKLIFKNFKGEKQKYNEKGNRNFGVLIDRDLAEELKADGWKIMYLKPREEGEEPQPWMKVKVKFGDYPPIINLITSKGRRRLDEDTVDMLDWTQAKNIDLIIRPYNYPATDDRPAGVAAYLKSIYVTVLEDEFEQKYKDIPYLDGEEEDTEE